MTIMNMARTIWGRATPGGSRSGSTNLPKISRVTRGTPRMSSMKPTQNAETAGRLLRRPRARRIPMGNETKIPTMATMRLRRSPPHCSTRASPSDRTTRMAGKERIHAKRRPRRPRRPVPRPTATPAAKTATAGPARHPQKQPPPPPPPQLFDREPSDHVDAQVDGEHRPVRRDEHEPNQVEGHEDHQGAGEDGEDAVEPAGEEVPSNPLAGGQRLPLWGGLHHGLLVRADLDPLQVRGNRAPSAHRPPFLATIQFREFIRNEITRLSV